MRFSSPPGVQAVSLSVGRSRLLDAPFFEILKNLDFISMEKPCLWFYV